MRLIASMAVAAALTALAGSASAASLTPLGESTLAQAGTQPTVVCSKRRQASGFYGGFIGDGYRRPYYSGFYGSDRRRFRDEGAAPPYAFFPNPRRVYRMWGWAPYDNGSWY